MLICGSGVGASVAANKIPGIRAAICHDAYSAHQGVEHDDMNVLVLGGRIIGPALAQPEVAMRGPRPSAMRLTEAERRGLEALIRRHTAPQQVALRARIVLAAAEGRNNGQIARRLGLEADTVRLWRGRWLGLQADPAGRAERRGPAGRCAAAGPAGRGSPPSRSARSSPWPARPRRRPAGRSASGRGREIADEIVRRGIVDRHLAPPRRAALKTAGLQAAPGPVLADPGRATSAFDATVADDLRALPRGRRRWPRGASGR